MVTTLAALFAESRGKPVTWRGKEVHAMYEFPEAPSRISIKFESSKDSPVQGLKFKIRGGLIVSNGQSATDVLFWRDTAPEAFDFEILSKPSKKQPTVLRFWNIFRWNITTMAWLGNAGMVIEELDKGHLVVNCSDDSGEPAFDALVARIRYE